MLQVCYNKRVVKNGVHTELSYTIKFLILKGIDIMMKEKKVTKRDRYTEIRAILETNGKEELVKFIDHELDLLAKKNSSDRKPTATQKANEELKALVLSLMEDNRLYTISEMLKVFDLPEIDGNPISNQKLSALVNRMVDEGKVTKTIDKRKSYFTKVGE